MSAEGWTAPAAETAPPAVEDRWANNPNAGAARSPEARRSRSRSPVRMDTREGGDGRDDGRRDDRGRPAQAGQNPGNNLHVSGLSTRVEDRDLEEVFGKFGRIQKTQVMRDPHTKDSRGFAFVTMESSEEADAAVAGMNATELMGRTMMVEKARRGRARTPTPGQYHGPPKKEENGYRPYEPSRSGGGGYGGGGGGGYSSRDDYRGSSSRDSYGGGRDRYDDRDGRGGGGGGYAIPMRGADDRRDSRREDGGRREERRPAYEERRSGGDDRRYDDRRGSSYSGGGGSRY